jgi:hypothetical protein
LNAANGFGFPQQVQTFPPLLNKSPHPTAGRLLFGFGFMGRRRMG